VVENGPVRAKIRVVKTFVDSVVSQDIVLYADVPRIDFITDIDWKEKHIMLKAAFPVDVNADKAAYDIQFGSFERPTHKNTSWDVARFEACGHKWADLSEAGYGVSLLNDCKYGHDIHDGDMRLTLLRCPDDPNPCADVGRHHFTYSLYPHEGGWREGGTEAQAHDLNRPMAALLEPAHKGGLASSFSLVSVDKGNVVIDTVKQAEDSGDMVVRVYESQGRRAKAKLRFHGGVSNARECDLMESDISLVNLDGDGFEFEIKPYEIKTFKAGAFA
jgi:alpha-mannosidase